MKNPWAVACVAVACIGSITVLAIRHADVTAMLGVLLTVVGGLTLSTHQQTNGNMSRLLQLVEDQSRQLAATMPPPTPIPPAPPPDPGTGA